MINQDQSIACPVCQTKIPFDTNQLLRGVKFSCPNEQCDASIGLSTESQPMVEKSIEKFNEIKNEFKK